MSAPKSGLIHAAAAFLEAVARASDESGGACELPAPPAATPPAPPEQRRGRWLSPLEARVVEFLRGRGDYQSADTIARALGLACDNRFKAILTNLADRDVIESLSGSGYRYLP